MNELPKDSFFQDDTGRLSLTTTMENTRDTVFGFACVGLFGGGVLWAISSWGLLPGLIFGTILSGIAAFGLFALGIQQVWARWIVFAVFAFLALVFLLILV